MLETDIFTNDLAKLSAFFQPEIKRIKLWRFCRPLQNIKNVKGDLIHLAGAYVDAFSARTVSPSLTVAVKATSSLMSKDGITSSRYVPSGLWLVRASKS